MQKKNKRFGTTLQEIGFSPTLVPLYLRVVNGCVVQPKHGTEFSDIGTVFRIFQD